MNRGSSPFSRKLLKRQLPFNEAPIHESGKCGATFLHEIPAFPPSMRPRFMNRGSRYAATADAGLLIAFNEAPIHESGKC